VHDIDKHFQEPEGVLHVLKKLCLTVRRGKIVMVTGPDRARRPCSRSSAA